jgi:hypothetical protein
VNWPEFAFAIALPALVLLGAMFKTRRCWFHDDEAVAVDHGQQVVPNDFSLEARQQANAELLKGFGEPYTRVLYRCKNCRRATSRLVVGAWTLEQVRGEEPRTPIRGTTQRPV